MFETLCQETLPELTPLKYALYKPYTLAHAKLFILRFINTCALPLFKLLAVEKKIKSITLFYWVPKQARSSLMYPRVTACPLLCSTLQSTCLPVASQSFCATANSQVCRAHAENHSIFCIPILSHTFGEVLYLRLHWKLSHLMSYVYGSWTTESLLALYFK